MTHFNANPTPSAAPLARLFDGARRAAVSLAFLGLSGAMMSSVHAQTPAKPGAAQAMPAASANGSSSVAPTATATATATAKAIFAGGCFWCVESDFDKVPGVVSTTSGYIGGKTAKPTYAEVSGNGTGHAEAVEIVFDPAKVSYSQLVEHFWRTIDPTTKDQQFCDRGSPYRTAIFAQDAEQLKTAQASRSALEKTKPFKEPIVTEVVLANAFYPAEGYHQDYYLKNPVRYKYYRSSCGRDSRLKQLWGDKAAL